MPKIPFQTSPKSIWDPSISVEKFRPRSPKNNDFRRLDPFQGANQRVKWTKVEKSCRFYKVRKMGNEKIF